MQSLAQYLPTFPGFAGQQTYAAWPVWSGSTTKEIKFQPLRKKQATRLWHRARDFDRQTREPGHHGGKVGHAALQVLHTLIFDFLNYASGRLDPSHAAIARKANVCERTVRNALNRLRGLGILNWVRRCAESWRDGKFCLEQETNAYAVLPDSQWRGYTSPPEPPAPDPATWGATPPLPSVIEQAAAESRETGSLLATARILAYAASGGVEAALAQLAWTMQSANPQ